MRPLTFQACHGRDRPSCPRGRSPPRSLSRNTSPELGYPCRLFEDDPGIVVRIGASGLAFVCDARVRPIGNARTATAALLVAHDIPPLGFLDVAMAVRER